MALNMATMKWLWVTIGVAVAMVVAYAAAFCVVTAYSGYLGIEAQGAPDAEAINEFANNWAAAISSVFVVLGTMLGGFLAARKATVDKAQNGLMVGIITGFVMLVGGIFNGFSLWVLVGLALAVAGGWLGGRLGGGVSS